MDPRLGRAGLGLALAAAAAVLTHAQPAPQNAAPIASPAPPPVIEAPQSPQTAPSAAPAPANIAEPAAPPEEKTPPPPPKPEVPVAPTPPPGPPPPVRSPTAVLRVLDKVTAETMRFEAPVGRRVRYKTLIFNVKVCETRGLSDPLPRPSAYVVIDSQPPAPPGMAAPSAKEIYRGWMFAASPGLHPFEHPVYDAWLEACTSATPPA
ncbi:MAG TPA: DUF2155 domain-containing protein [Caulobacteraceae bacterium]|nr:DUF2155 domain-containing protein [Caulobacteraceae bacterium]